MDTLIPARPYAVGIFDVLGFKCRFEKFGLGEITARYAALAEVVRQMNWQREKRNESFPALKDGPYWCAGGEIQIMTTVFAAYASDTFLVWAHHTWTELHERSESELDRLSKDPSHDWLFRPIPCDALLETCNELICRSLEVDLPLRGALAVGDAVLDRERTMFLGAPIIEANAMEGREKFIGAGMCSSFAEQEIPSRFRLPFNRQMKDARLDGYSGLALDWARHWRKTRKLDLRTTISGMDTKPEFSEYYQNTLASIDRSDEFANQFESLGSCPIRSNYDQFSYARKGNISGYAMAVRRVDPTKGNL